MSTQNDPAIEVAAALDEETARFVQMANDPLTRQDLLARLQSLGLLAAFLEAERGTN